jgi:hypothetical protein
MKREARDFRETAPKPVKRIPLDIKNHKLRLILMILALAIAAGAFYYGFNQLFSVEAGWTTLEADSSSGLNVSGDFQLQVELGAGGEAPLTERKRLTTVYSDAARKAYTLYTTQEYVADTNNVWYINHHPGEEIQVDAELYRALQHTLSAGNWLYLGPVYEVWDSVWFSQTDEEAAAADPRKDAELAEFITRTTGYIASGDIRLELRDNNIVFLNISDECRAFGEEYGIARWIDFGWQKNAYIIDDLAEALTASGWRRAVLSSKDGFIRCLDDRQNFALKILADSDGSVKQIGQAEYKGPAALMVLVPGPGGDRRYSYRYQDGMLRTAWISPEDGLDARPVDGLAAYAEEGGCRDLLGRFLNCLTRTDADETEWKKAAGSDCTLWLARQGVLTSFGNGGLTLSEGKE